MAVTTVTGGTSRTVGQQWASPNNQYQLRMEAGGDLAYYSGLIRVWHAGTTLGVRVTFQADGNLVVYEDASGNDTRPLWSSTTAGYTGATLQIDDGGRLAILSSGGGLIRVLWQGPSEIMFNEGKDWVANHPVAGAQVFAFLFHTKKISDGGLSAISKLVSDVVEVGGTGYARKPIFLGTSTDGILTVPSTTWNTGTATGWPSDVTGWGISNLVTGGVAIYCWEFTGGTPPPPYDMSGSGAQVVIPASQWFFFNPGEA